MSTARSMEVEVSTDKSRLDRQLIHGFLSASYWAAGIPRELVDRSIENSLCFGAFIGDRQIAFARVITDCATFACLADVFVVGAERGRGVSKRLVRAILDHPELQGLRRFMLATLDAQGLYETYGFRVLEHPERFMEIHKSNAYGQPTGN